MAELRKEKIKLKNGIALVNVSVVEKFDPDKGLPGKKRYSHAGVQAMTSPKKQAACIAYLTAQKVYGKSALQAEADLIESMTNMIIEAHKKELKEKRINHPNRGVGRDERPIARKDAIKWSKGHFPQVLGILPYGARIVSGAV